MLINVNKNMLKYYKNTQYLNIKRQNIALRLIFHYNY